MSGKSHRMLSKKPSPRDVRTPAYAGQQAGQATFGRTEAMPDDFFADRRGYLRIGAVLAALVWVIAVMDSLGFCLTMLAFYVVLLQVLGRQHPVVTAAIGLAGSFGVYYVFVHWLAVSLPAGMLAV